MTTPTYTAEQELAISTRDTTIALDAGAGCGKTFVLTERFLSHLDPEAFEAVAELDELIAITFTDAAAREMRDRVRQKCLQRLQAADEVAGDYWLRLLRSLDSARISTIHSFCGALIRSHAIELGLDPAFGVLDQASADVLASESTDDYLREQLDAANDDVISLAAEFGITGLKSRLDDLVDRRHDAAFGKWLNASPEDALDAWDIHQRELADEHLKTLKDLPAIDELLYLLSQTVHETPSLPAKREKLYDLIPNLREGAIGTEAYGELKKALDLRGVTVKCWATSEEHASYHAAAKEIRAHLEAMPNLADPVMLQSAAELGLSLLRTAAGVVDAYTATKRTAGVLDYEDLLIEARRLLTSPDFSDTQQRLSSQVRLLLVDEFQDTNRLQVELVKALVGPGFSEGRLFFVGDFKQSIYRFRGAEPAVFRDLQLETTEAGRLPLTKNFRSQPAVLAFVNQLFGSVFGDRYRDLEPARPQVTLTPAVELLRTEPPEEDNATARRKAEARAIAQRLRGLLDNQTPIVAAKNKAGEFTAKPVRQGDIALLFQALSDVQHYEEALREQNIEYYLVGGHAFYAQQEIYDVLNLLRSIASECDDVSLAGVLRSPFFSLEDETLFWLAESGRSLNVGLLDAKLPPQLSPLETEKTIAARDTLQQLRQLKGNLSTAELITTALERTGYDAVLLSEFLGERKRANLAKLLEQARASDRAAADNAAAGDLDRFIRQLAEFTVRQPKEALASTSSEGADVVRLMTVHRAKGLEFPVVVLPEMHRKKRNDSSSAAFDPQLGPLAKPTGYKKDDGLLGIDLFKQRNKPEEQAEQDRKFYVACTRAADYLMLSAVFNQEEAEDPKCEWLATLSESFDLMTGELLAGDPEAGPLMQVTLGQSNPPKQTAHGKQADRLAMLDAADEARQKPAAPLATIEPIAIAPESRQRFSVSKLTGQLHHSAHRPETIALDQALGRRSEGTDPRGLGTLVHEVMERVNFIQASNPIADWCLALAPLHVNREVELAASEAQQLIETFLASDRAKQLAGAKRIEREVEFLLAWPPKSSGDTAGNIDAYLQGYIDCLWQDDNDHWWVLDYKTNQGDVTDVQELAETYRLQMLVYALAVEAATGKPPAGGQLHFMRPGVEVQFDWNDTTQQEAIELVTQKIADIRQSNR